MKKAWIIGLVLLAGCPLGFAQWSGYTLDEGNELDAGIGMAWIDNQSYYALTFQPDFSIGKFGIGIGIQLLYDTKTGHIRTIDWNSSSDWARLIRYIRWGHKGDPLYSRLGALDAERIGHGFIMNFFNNQINYDERKLGLVFDVDLGYGGFESMTNTLGRAEVIGLRGYGRPLYGSKIPILKNFAIGASLVTDLDPDAYKATKNGVTVWGLDMELPLLKTDMLKILLFVDHAKIQKYGSGQTVGMAADFAPIGSWFQVGCSFERRWLGEQFIPNYYGPFYEVLRHTTAGEVVDYYMSLGGDSSGIPAEYLPLDAGSAVDQQYFLPMITKERHGWFGSLFADVFHLIRLLGSYQMIDGQSQSGILHLGAELSQSIPVIALEADYDKRGMDQLKDITTLDYRSLARVGVGYKVMPFLLFYIDYIWSFRWDESIGQYRPQERFQPRLAFRYKF